MRIALPTIALLMLAWAFFASQGAEDAGAQTPAPTRNHKRRLRHNRKEIDENVG